MNFTTRRRFGISTVISTMIILSGVSILGATMVTWSYSNTTSRETVLATAASTRANTFNEFLSIENVWKCQGGGSPETCRPAIVPGCVPTYPAINATLTNIGSIGLNVTQITLATTVNGKLATSFFTIKNIALSPGQYYMWAQNYCNYQSKVPVTITATTARGSTFTTQVTLP